VSPQHHNNLIPDNIGQSSLVWPAILEPHGIEPLLLLFEMRDDTGEPGEGKKGCGYEFGDNSRDLTNSTAMLECSGKWEYPTY